MDNILINGSNLDDCGKPIDKSYLNEICRNICKSQINQSMRKRF